MRKRKVLVILTLSMAIIILIGIVNSLRDSKVVIADSDVIIDVKEEEIVINQMPKYDITLNKELQQFTWDQCEQRDIAYTLELALLYTESEFKGDAINYNDTCNGIGQLNDNTSYDLAKALQIENFNVFNEEHNIMCSVYYLSELREYWRGQGYIDEDVFGLMLLSYNRGITGCRKYIKNNNIYDDKYVNKVLNRKIELDQYGCFKY